MKTFLKILIGALLLSPTLVFANITVPFTATSTDWGFLAPNAINGNFDGLLIGATTTIPNIKPQAGTLLYILENATNARITSDTYANTVTGSIFQGRKARGTSVAPLSPVAGDTLALVGGDGYGTTGFHNVSLGAISITASGAPFTDTSAATDIKFFTSATTTIAATQRMILDSNGNLGVGLTTPGFARLEVQGTTTDSTANAFTAWNSAGTSIFNVRNDGLLTFNNLLVQGSSTIGNGTQGGGLTISGGATTTGNMQAAKYIVNDGGEYWFRGSPSGNNFMKYDSGNGQDGPAIYGNASVGLGIAGTPSLTVRSAGIVVGTTTTLAANSYSTFRENGVATNVNFETTGGAQKYFIIENTGTDTFSSGGFQIYRNGVDQGSLIANAGLFFNSDTVSNNISFAANGTTEFRILPSGNSTFGSTNNSTGALLSIQGSSTPWTENLLAIASTTGTAFLTVDASGFTNIGGQASPLPFVATDGKTFQAEGGDASFGNENNTLSITGWRRNGNTIGAISTASNNFSIGSNPGANGTGANVLTFTGSSAAPAIAIGSTTPSTSWAKLSLTLHADGTADNFANAFVIASSTVSSGTSTLFSVDNQGNEFILGNLNINLGAITGGITGPGTFQFANTGAGSFRWLVNGTQKMLFGTGDWRVSGDNELCWTSGTSVGSGDTCIGRSAAAVLQIGGGSGGSTGGLLAMASSSIGGGAQGTGLTISGGATTTANAYFAGKVGIGTVAPTASLHVVGGNALFEGVPSNSGYLFLKNGNYGIAKFSNNGVRIFTDASTNLQIGKSTGGIDGGEANFTPYLTFNTIGNLGLGTTSPFAKLSVHANNGDTNTTLFAIGSSTQSATTTLFSIDNTGHQITGTITKPVLSACGSTNSINGTDENGTIMLTGTLVTACTMTLAQPVPAGQNLSCQATSGTSAGFAFVSATTTSSVTFGISASVSADTIYYNCKENIAN